MKKAAKTTIDIKKDAVDIKKALKAAKVVSMEAVWGIEHPFKTSRMITLSIYASIVGQPYESSCLHQICCYQL